MLGSRQRSSGSGGSCSVRGTLSSERKATSPRRSRARARQCKGKAEYEGRAMNATYDTLCTRAWADIAARRVTLARHVYIHIYTASSRMPSTFGFTRPAVHCAPQRQDPPPVRDTPSAAAASRQTRGCCGCCCGCGSAARRQHGQLLQHEGADLGTWDA